MRRTLVVAEMAVRETTRRRTVLLLLFLMPLAFYLARRGDHLGQSIRFICLGLGWVLATAALFSGNAARGLEPRLRLGGYRPSELLVGRLLALWLLGLALCVPYLAILLVCEPDVRHGPVALTMALSVAVGAPLGLAIAAVLPGREQEGALTLLAVVALQMMVEPSASGARLQPFWFTREITYYATEYDDTGYLLRGLTHGLLAATLAVSVVAIQRRVAKA